MARITLNQVSKMKESGALMTDTEIQSQIAAKQKEIVSIESDGLIDLAIPDSTPTPKYEVLEANYDNIVAVITGIKEKTNAIIEANNKSDAKELAKSLVALWAEAEKSVQQLGIDLNEGLEQLEKKKPNFNNNVGILDKVFL